MKTRKDFGDIGTEYMEKIGYIKLTWEEKVIVLLNYGLIREMLTSIRDKEYKKLIMDKDEDKEEICKVINSKLKESLGKEIEKKFDDNIISFKKRLNKIIIGEIYTLLEEYIKIENRNEEIKIKDYYHKN